MTNGTIEATDTMQFARDYTVSTVKGELAASYRNPILLHGLICSFIHSFLQHLIIECLIFARIFPKCGIVVDRDPAS